MWLTARGCLLGIQSALEQAAREGESPVVVTENDLDCSRVLFLGYEAGIWEVSTSNSKYSLSPIAKSTVRER